MRFQKIGPVIEAIQATCTPESNREIIDWTRGSKTPASINRDAEDNPRLSITTLEGAMFVSPGDWIIKGVGHEFYPCKPEIFAASYKPVESTFDFGEAVRRLKAGKRVARACWNGKGMWLAYQKGYPNGIPINANTAQATGMPEGTVMKFLPYLMMKTAPGEFVPWLASQTDVLGEDWSEVQ